MPTKPNWASFTQGQPPPTSNKFLWFGKDSPSEEDNANAKLYFGRLKQLMEYEVAIGELTPTDAQAIIRQALLTPADRIFTDAPYAADIIGKVDKNNVKTIIPDWQWNLQVSNQTKDLQEYQQKQQKTDLELAATKRGYLPQLQNYLADAVSNFAITSEQADQYYKSEENQLNFGVKPSDMPNYQNVKDFTKTQQAQTTPEQIAANKSSAEFRQGYGNLPTDQYNQKAGERQIGMETAFGLRQPTEVSPKQNAYDMALAQAQTEQRNWGLSFASDQQAAERANRAELFKQFESIRNQKLNSLNTEADWIKRWFTQNEKNPYTPPEPSIDSTMGVLSTELAKWTDIANNYPDTPVNVGDTVTWGDIANQSINAISQNLATLRDLPPELNSPAAPQPTAPATPDWLANLVPELKTGQPIRSGVTIPTPSGQQWQQLAPSTQQKFSGYTDWAGIPIKDIVNRMNLMQTNTPQGAGRFGFAPSRQ